MKTKYPNPTSRSDSHVFHGMHFPLCFRFPPTLEKFTCFLHTLHTYINTYLYTYIHTYIHAYILTYMYASIHTYIHTYLYAYVPKYIHACTYIHTYIMYAYIHT